MKIALSYPDVNLRGGVDRVIVESANQLARGGHDVHVLATNWTEGVLDPAVHRHHVPTRPRLDAMQALGFRREATRVLDGVDWDVHGSFSALSPLGGAFWTPSVHRAAYDLMLARRGPSARLVQQVNPFHVVRLRLERELYAPGGYARVIALSERVKEEVHTHYDVPDEDVVVQPYGYDPAQFNVERRTELRERARSEHGYDDADRVVVFVANELERKGFDTLVAAIARLDDPSMRLLVVGRVDPHEYAALIAQHGLGDRIRFAGSSDDVAFHHAAADCFALPTRYEPWGLVIVEALASGLPVVTTAVAGAALAVRDGETGRLLQDADGATECAEALRWALSDDAPSPEHVNASVDWLRWERVIDDYVAILRRSFGVAG